MTTADRFDDLVAAAFRRDEVDRFVRDHAVALVATRRHEVIAWLADPARGPGPVGTAAVVAVVRILGPTPSLERAWLRWIEEGRFDGHPEDVSGATARDLVEGLRTCVEQGVLTEAHALVHGALAHWSALLRSPDAVRHQRGLEAVDAVIASGRPFPGALPSVVERAVRADRSADAQRALAGLRALFAGT